MNNENTVLLPRFRGRVIPKGTGFTFEIYITIGADTDENTLTMTADRYQTYLNHEAALNALRETTVDVMKVICEKLGAPMPDSVLDFKKGKMRSIDEFAKPIKFGESK